MIRAPPWKQTKGDRDDKGEGLECLARWESSSGCPSPVEALGSSSSIRQPNSFSCCLFPCNQEHDNREHEAALKSLPFILPPLIKWRREKLIISRSRVWEWEVSSVLSSHPASNFVLGFACRQQIIVACPTNMINNSARAFVLDAVFAKNGRTHWRRGHCSDSYFPAPWPFFVIKTQTQLCS